MTPDFVIVGGGPAGATAARELASAGFRVTILATVGKRAVSLGESLLPDARHLLRAAGIERKFLAQGHRACYGHHSAWGSDELVTEDFIFRPDGHGWQLDRTAFDALLLEAAEAAGAEILWDARVRGIRTEHGATCVLAECQGRSMAVAATTIIDASGRACVVARAAGATRHSTDRLAGVACLLSGSDGSDTEAIGLIEAVADGWWYSTLLPSGRLAIFFSDADMPALTAARTTSVWMAALQRTRHLRALVERHRYQPSANPRVVAANSARLTAFHGPGWLAVGDAAMSYDPLSGRGIFAAMHGARQAAYALTAAARGEEKALEKYGAQLDQAHTDYLAALSQNYRAESRWSSTDFWQRRHQTPGDIGKAMHARRTRDAT